ncbi:hypothetical protein D3C72_2333690 [compost metagenome]
MHLQVGLASGILQAGEAHFQRKLGMPRGMKNSLCQAGWIPRFEDKRGVLVGNIQDAVSV